MTRTATSLALCLLCCTGVFAQHEVVIPKEGERPPRPEGASNAAIGGWCDALTGAKKYECLRDERRRQDKNAKPSTRGTCDALVGSERERCLRATAAAASRDH